MEKSAERYVSVADVEAGQAADAFTGSGDMAIPRPLEFAPIERTYFRAEHTLSGRDIIIHFFVPERLRQYWTTDQIERWWLNGFARGLSDTAEDYFQATIPRITAKYTPELASWWFRAQGFDHLLDLGAYLVAFYEQLDETLHSALLPKDAAPLGTA